jgi:ferredoxin-NADP reductase
MVSDEGNAMSATGKTPAVQPPPNMVAVQVVRREIVAHDTVSLFVAVPGTQRAPAPYLPGQFVTLAIPTPNETLYRSYSLCGTGSPNVPWEITIKKMRNGLVSTFLFEKVQVGTRLYVGMPRGAFVLPNPVRRDTPLIFVAAGSGITPIRGMLRTIAQLHPGQRPTVHLHYAAASPEDIIYRQELAQLDPQHTWLWQWYYLSSEGKRLTPNQPVELAGPLLRRAHWYMCGPDTLRRDMQALLAQKGVPPTMIHAEVFSTTQQRGTGTRMSLPFRGGVQPGVAQLTIQETQAVLDVQSGETLLTALERHGYQPDYECRVGTCGTCKLRLLAGKVNPRGSGVLTQQEMAAGYVLSCIARPQGDVTLLSGGRPPVRGRAPVAAAVAASRRATSRTLVRASCVLALGGLLLGTWNLTNHRPDSWTVQAAAPAATSTPLPGATNTPPPVATDTPTPVFGVTDTPTPVFGGGGGDTPTPVPTDTPQPPTATPIPPAPTPTVGTRPSSSWP